MTNAEQPRDTKKLFDDAPDLPDLPEDTGNLPEPVDGPSTQVAPVEETASAPREPQEPREHQPEEAPAPAPAKPKVKKTAAGSMWVGLVVSAILLIVLLVFILQNQQQSELNLFGWTWNFPVGVGMLFAAILGALITALIGGWRMMDLRRQIRKG